MNLNVLATNTTSQQQNPWSMIIMLVVLVAVFYFFMIRPQRKQQKQEEKMRNDLQIGDEIISIGGICGKVVSIKDDSIIVESPADHSKTKLLRTAIQTNTTVRDEVKKNAENEKKAAAEKKAEKKADK